MKKTMGFLVALVLALTLAVSAFGEALAGKNMAVSTLTDGAFPVEVRVDVSTGLSVAFYSGGFSLFEGPFDDSTYPLVTATMLADGVYEQYLADNKDREDFHEESGIYSYTSIIGEFCMVYKIGGTIPFIISFDKSVDAARAEEIIKCLEFVYD